MPELGDAPIEQPFVKAMKAFAEVIDETFNGDNRGADRKTGFVLIVFPFAEARPGGGGRANYISNANRADVVTMLKEQIRRFEGQPEVSGTA